MSPRRVRRGAAASVGVFLAFGSIGCAAGTSTIHVARPLRTSSERSVDVPSPRPATISAPRADSGSSARVRCPSTDPLRGGGPIDEERCVAAYVARADAQRREGTAQSLEAALDSVSRALAIEAGSVAALDQLALVYLAQGHFSLAEDAARRAIALRDDFAPAHNTLGLVHVRRGEIDRAVSEFAIARTIDPSLFAAFMNEGALALGARGYEAAHALFTRAIELRPDAYDAWLGLGVACRGMNDDGGARVAYERAIALDPTRPDAYFDLGLLLHLYGDGTEPTAHMAASLYEHFLQRAGARPEYASTVELVTRRCPIAPRARRRRRWQRDCPGIGLLPALAFRPSTEIAFIQEAEQMQADVARIQAQAEAQARVEAASQAEAPASAIDDSTASRTGLPETPAD